MCRRNMGVAIGHTVKAMVLNLSRHEDRIRDRDARKIISIKYSLNGLSNFILYRSIKFHRKALPELRKIYSPRISELTGDTKSGFVFRITFAAVFAKSRHKFDGSSVELKKNAYEEAIPGSHKRASTDSALNEIVDNGSTMVIPKPLAANSQAIIQFATSYLISKGIFSSVKH